MPPPLPLDLLPCKKSARRPRPRRRPGRRLAAARSRPPAKHPPGDVRLRPRRRGLLLARRQDDHLPGRGEGHRQPVLPDLRQDLATGRARRVSPGVGKTTCAYFCARRQEDHLRSAPTSTPTRRSTTPPSTSQREEEQKAGRRRRYTWDFDPHMDIFEANPDGTGLKRLTDAKGYDAEGSYSPDGKQIVFCSQPRRTRTNLRAVHHGRRRQERPQADQRPRLLQRRAVLLARRQAVIFRSDRKKKDHLQLYVIDADGKNERALTDDLDLGAVGAVLVQGRQAHRLRGADHGEPGRPNYDLYWMDVDTGKKVRLTHAPGADVLPVFSPDGKKLMWTSTRDGAGRRRSCTLPTSRCRKTTNVGFETVAARCAASARR